MVQFSHSVVSDSLQPHGMQHFRPPCPSPTPGIYPNSCPLSRWCHPTISCSVVTFSSCFQYFPALGSFPVSSSHQVAKVLEFEVLNSKVLKFQYSKVFNTPKYWSFSFNISPSKEHSGRISFRMNWLDLLAVQGTLKSHPTPQFKSINSSVLSFLYSPTHIHTWLLKKP